MAIIAYILANLPKYPPLYICRESSTNPLFYAKQTQFPGDLNEHKPFYYKPLRQFPSPRTPQKQTQNKPKTNPIQTQFKPNSNPIQTQSNPISDPANLCEFFLFSTFLGPGYNLAMQNWTIQKILNWITQYFTDKGLDSPAVGSKGRPVSYFNL
ncbi:MAG: hypothetical protein ACYS1A_08125 [Planctomycetota bacterium]|jgi:hypothetical protein